MRTLIFVTAAVCLQAQTTVLTRQIEPSGSTEFTSGIASDPTGVYITAAKPVPGNRYQSVLRKLDARGAELWTSGFGSASVYLNNLAVSSSGVYVVGSASEQLPGQTGAGQQDALIRKYDFNGNEQWTREFGTSGADQADYVAADGTAVYVIGEFGTPPNMISYLRKYDFAGNAEWTHQFTSGLAAGRVAADATGVYVSGGALGPATGQVIQKYDPSGNELWSKSVAGPVEGLAGGSNGVYAITTGNNPSLASYDRSGAQRWISPLDAANRALPFYLTAASDVVYVAGLTAGTLPGQCRAGGGDAFVAQFDTTGKQLWARQFGTYRNDSTRGVTADAAGVYVAWNDAWLSKLDKTAATVTSSKPRIAWECVVNAASYEGGAVAPGEIVTILGSGLGPASLVSSRGDNGRLPAAVAESRVLFDGVPAPMLYASSQALSAIVPYGVGGKTSTDVQVEFQGARSDVLTIPVLDTRPGIFSLDGSGAGQAAALNQNGTLNSASNPADQASVVSIYATGEGLTNPVPADGSIAGDRPPTPKLQVALTCGTGCIPCAVSQPTGAPPNPFEVVYAGGVSGSVAGLMRIDVRLGKGFAPGPWTLQLQIGSAIPLQFGDGISIVVGGNACPDE